MIARIAVVLAAVVVVAGSTLAMESAVDAHFTHTIVLIVAIVVVMVTGLVIARDPRIPLVCDPLFLLFVFLSQFFVIGPIGLRVAGSFKTLFFRPFAPERPAEVLVAVLVFLLMVLTGYRVQVGEVLASWLPDFAQNHRKLPVAWIEVLLVGGSILGCFGWVLFQGGLLARFSVAYGGGRPGGALFRIAFVGLQVGTLLMAWRALGSRAQSRLYRLALVSVLAFEIVFFGVITGARKNLLFLFFGLFAVYVLRRGVSALPKIRMAAILGLLLVFFSVWGTLRTRPIMDLVEGRDDRRYAPTEGLHRGYVSGVSGPFATACLVWEVFPEQEPFKHGRTLLVTLLGFIPRSVWPEKPIGIGKEMTRWVVGPMYEASHGYSVTVTLPADFYLNFGWLGILAGGYLVGVVCRGVTAYAIQDMRGGKQYIAARILIPAVFIMGLGEIRSDMATILSTYALSLLPLLIALNFFRFDVDRPESRVT